MLQALWAVIVDLFQFACKGVMRREATVLQLEAPTVSAGLLVRDTAPATPLLASDGGRQAYVAALTCVCFARPIIAFDTKLGSLSYGARVIVLKREGMFVYVEGQECSGWVNGDELVYEKEFIIPQLQPGTVYEYDNTETIKIRTALNDECLGGVLCLPLQPVEYVLYVLAERGVKVAWPPVRPRTPGSLQVLLRGLRGVRIGIEPKTGALMEYRNEEGKGVIGLIEAVHPDETIILRSVGKEKDGEYRVETIQKDAWRELRPVFISFV